ncbi:AraC family transcriptional regulator ligand-binding domain-containing protein [Paraperlucidibaca sp.]|jgi:AraC-like DNA-binding protein|uniref:AraC family transcriptional regulator n=1 Tax=Paraperlucidibaca sp. TaxID=2708021 RepID=UPI0030F392B2|tara:strand:+ start:486 stop:1538 length:1053 start_codon:yes stop_codon:yes gene_type:complete
MLATPPHNAIAVVGQYLVFLIDFMAPRGLSAEVLLAHTGLNEASLREHPDQPIALSTLLELMRNLHTLDPSPTLSLEFGLSMQLSNHGFLGYALQASPTLGDALRLAHDFAEVRSQIISFSFHESGSSASIRIDDNGAMGDCYRYIVEVMMACFFSIGTKLLGRLQLNQVQLNLAIEEQSQHRILKQMFAANLHFQCSTTEVTFPSSWLSARLPQSDPQLAALAASRCRDELQQAQRYADQSTLPQTDFIAKVLNLLEREMASSNAQEVIAAALHITPRTLHRRLAQHGLQFKALLDELRHKAALEQLRLQRDSLANIALALGYSDQANFVRAFKRWTGQTPSQFLRGIS